MTTPELLKGPAVAVAPPSDDPDSIGGRLPGNRFSERDTDEVITLECWIGLLPAPRVEAVVEVW